MQSRVREDPGGALDEYLFLKAYVDTLYDELKAICSERDGRLQSRDGAVLRKIKKKLKKLNGGKAADILADAGYDPMMCGEFKLSEDSLKVAFGVTEGNRILKVLKDAGCYSVQEIEYYGIKA